ncbi:meiosis 1 arrest protein isoform X1 [Phascolarctos cinereus]|uniref:Meiosis 1 arrest protein isoform X1 n=1 Tax=Phascolarctos cinereus TaxID=38626 RepID=A0A6P5LY47_PHACI|nr:meiosis 1 arrest protein isoform X1 [Phascolarctos cinereus]XP_020860975.1 meiosis 1 arrest protein isoform X1 [Phascolarctos cinereus]XP_020860976.1 meiosis 1 arrest protein isoform X1 [Phascolarctos cinereus]XP_020860977.1 meiosis 1 arrest protein isoform X1 [Phascolarctos cinereus]
MHRGHVVSQGPLSLAHVWQQPPRLLIVDAACPSWARVCSNLCEALQNFFSLACSLEGPTRVPLFSMYVVQSRHECILPFVQVKGNFVRLQACISELRLVPREGICQQKSCLNLAVQDGLQQFKQHSRHTMVSAAPSSPSVEITVLTCQPGKDIVKQLEGELQNTDMVSLRRLQVTEISKGDGPESVDSLWPSEAPAEELSTEECSILGTDIELQVIENDTVSIESFFKAWLQDSGTDQEHLHLLLPSRCFSSFSSARSEPMCLKCDLQERLLNPALLPGTAESPGGDFSYQMAPQSAASRYRLRVIKALESSGVCESVTYGLPFIIRPTSCWQLDWDELETNQQRFHALCHSLQKRQWLLLAKGEPPSPGPSQNGPASTFYIIFPSSSLTMLVKAVATCELLLPNSFPMPPEDPPEDILRSMENTLDGLEVASTYNPLQIKSCLYEHLRSILSKPQGPLSSGRELRPPRQVGRLHPQRARATVPPLPLVPSLPPSRAPKMPAAKKASSEPVLLLSDDEEQLF